MFHRRHLNLNALPCVLWLGMGCAPPSAETVPDVARPVKVFTVEAAAGAASREWPGRVEPTHNAELSFDSPGKLVDLPVDEGQSVTKGTVLAKLDPRDFRARLDAAQAQYRQVRAEFDRTKILIEQEVVARSELDLRSRMVSVAKSDVDQARKALDDATLVAPFDGTVARTFVDNFQTVQAKQPVVLLQDSSSLEIVTYVSERDMAMARPGLTIEERNSRIEPKVVFDALDGREFDCELKEIATSADRVTQTFEVTWTITPPEGVNILPGMTAKVKLGNFSAAPSGAPLLIPARAVVGASEGGSLVWKIDPETMVVSKLPVEVGSMRGASIEVTAGLESGTMIAVSGVGELAEGDPVSRFDDLFGKEQRAQ